MSRLLVLAPRARLLSAATCAVQLGTSLEAVLDDRLVVDQPLNPIALNPIALNPARTLVHSLALTLSPRRLGLGSRSLPDPLLQVIPCAPWCSRPLPLPVCLARTRSWTLRRMCDHTVWAEAVAQVCSATCAGHSAMLQAAALSGQASGDDCVGHPGVPPMDGYVQSQIHVHSTVQRVPTQNKTNRQKKNKSNTRTFNTCGPRLQQQH